MGPEWVGVIGAVGGGLVGVLGTWLAQKSSMSESHRAERRDAYADFLEHANRGIRTVESIRSYEKRFEDANPDMTESTTPARLPFEDTMRQLRVEANDFIHGSDRSLAVVQLVAPVRLLEAARYLHDGIVYFNIDGISSDELSGRFKDFAALAYFDLSSGWLGRRAAALHRTKGLPHRRDPNS